jgi:hypothetical protein
MTVRGFVMINREAQRVFTWVMGQEPVTTDSTTRKSIP